jgi:hypothetical protein
MRFCEASNHLAVQMGVSVLTLLCTTSPASARCDVSPFVFRPPHNDSVSTTAFITKGGRCVHTFRSFSMLQLTSASIASRPANGMLEDGPLRFRYTPKPGFKGTDRYSVRVCATGTSGSGCSTITYNVTVN